MQFRQTFLRNRGGVEALQIRRLLCRTRVMILASRSCCRLECKGIRGSIGRKRRQSTRLFPREFSSSLGFKTRCVSPSSIVFSCGLVSHTSTQEDQLTSVQLALPTKAYSAQAQSAYKPRIPHLWSDKGRPENPEEQQGLKRPGAILVLKQREIAVLKVKGVV